MPRSGTSLVEQVISQHSRVYAGGELPFIGEIIKNLSGSHATNRIQLEHITSLNGSDISNYAREYLYKIERLSSSAQRITDKKPSNYL